MTEKVFQEQFFCYRHDMYRFARNLLNSETDAQDVVQGVMMNIWQKRSDLKDLDNRKAYVMKAVKNDCINKMQQQERRSRHLAVAGSMQPGWVNNARGNTAQIISHFIAGLPQKQQQVILLKDIEEFETSEIAEMLEMDENAVRTNLARARQKVRDYLQKIEIYEQQQIR